uniref:Uncharacterized protein n=1 Tax=Meloidogyne enterolobii TaxID=390850 RepID=A0A6V7UET1_MELEN|nr:unnamed protein product [Meloidogyne enterolobii]
MKDSNKNLEKEVFNVKNKNKIVLEKGETSKSKQNKSPRIIRKYKTRKSKKLEDEKIAEEIALEVLNSKFNENNMTEDVLKINENIENKKDKQIIETNQIIGKNKENIQEPIMEDNENLNEETTENDSMHHSQHNNEIIDHPQQEHQEVEQMAIENNEQTEKLNG